MLTLLNIRKRAAFLSKRDQREEATASSHVFLIRVLGVLEKEIRYKTGHISTRNFMVFKKKICKDPNCVDLTQYSEARGIFEQKRSERRSNSIKS